MNTSKITILGLAAAIATAALAPMAAHADQKNKNLWRNGALAGGAVALYGLTQHNSTATLLGAGAAAYSANRYEQDRHHQSQQQAARDQRARYYRYHHRYHRSYR